MKRKPIFLQRYHSIGSSSLILNSLLFFKGLMTRQNPGLERCLKAITCTNDDLEQRPLSRQQVRDYVQLPLG